MYYIDPHIHMISRVTDDYQRMAYAGCVALSEPAFWAGFDRGSAEGFRDYFRHLTEVEPKRAALFGIRHYCWLCINAKEAENVKLSREVIALIPSFFTAVWGISRTAVPLGGTSVLITVGVALETMKQVESQLLMRHYEGFLG